MNLPGNLFATAFRHQRLGLMMAVIIAIMVYLGSLAMAAQSVLARTTLAWGHDLQTKLTVEIPVVSDEAAETRQAKVQQILTQLRAKPEITAVTEVPESETARLLKPWIVDPALLDALPLPRLLDVHMKSGATLDHDALRRTLAQSIPGVQVHAHAAWMNGVMSFLRALGALAWIMLGLTAFALMAAIAVVCKAAMAVQHDTIELLHFMGATDSAIAKQFQKHIQRLATPAALIGFCGAAVTALALVFLLSALGGLSLIAPVSWVTLAIVMALVPLGATTLAMVTARVSVKKFLRRLT